MNHDWENTNDDWNALIICAIIGLVALLIITL